MAASSRMRLSRGLILVLVLAPAWKIVEPLLRPGPQAVSQGVPPFNDRPAPPALSPDSPKHVHPLPPAFWVSAAAAKSGGTA